MALFGVLKYVSAGFGLQIVLLILLALLGLGELVRAIYWPWFLFGEWVAPSGAAGHAMPGGAILGFLFGMFLYSVLIGTSIGFFRNVRRQDFN